MSDAALHAELLTLDSHIDIPWPETPDPNIDGPRRVDLPKMQRGGLWAGCFAAFVPQGPRDAAGHAAARARVDEMLGAIELMAAAAAIPAALVEDEAGIRAARAANRIAILRAVENGHALGEDLSLLATLRARGVRYITLSHNGHNALADSAIPRKDLGDEAELHGGLSGLGRDCVAEMNRLGILVDVSHLSKRAMLQSVQISRVPVVATHSCAATLCPHPRNLDDLQLEALAETGGVIQVTAMDSFLRPRAKGGAASVVDLVDHIDHVVQRIGAAHVGISSDFDGGGGIEGWQNASESANVTAELQRRGYGHAEIAAFWGGNFLRVLSEADAESGIRSDGLV